MKREVNMRAPIQNARGKRTNDKKTPPHQENGKTNAESRINTDPLGSWTGVPEDPYFDKPIQDADDL